MHLTFPDTIMWSTKIFPLLLLLFFRQASATPRDCCSNPNILGKSKCINGNDTILKCVKYLVPAENKQALQFHGDAFIFDEDTEIPLEQ